MNWMLAKVYDWVMQSAEEEVLGRWRRELLAEATGEVVDIGAGTGANLAWYPKDVQEVTAVEPDPHMRAELARKLPDRDRRTVRLVDAGAGDMPFDDGVFDTAVLTLVLCSVPDPAAALAEIRRVLAPEGKLLFLEHVAAEEGSATLTWQRRLEPFWRPVAGDCHLTRHSADLIAEAGFDIETCRRETLPVGFPWIRPTVRGTAINASSSNED